MRELWDPPHSKIVGLARAGEIKVTVVVRLYCIEREAIFSLQ
jgi:hypothetical protein